VAVAKTELGEELLLQSAMELDEGFIVCLWRRGGDATDDIV
jgi:hypothetical protein